MTLVVMAAPLDLTRPHRQQRLGAVERLDLGLFIHAEHQGAVGRVEVEPDNVADLSTNSGSVESLKVSTRCGCKPKARQMRPTLEVEMPL